MGAIDLTPLGDARDALLAELDQEDALLNAAKPARVSLVPTWAAVANVFIAALEDGTPEGKRLAREEIRAMAKVADLAVAQEPNNLRALLGEAADALRDLKRRAGIVTIGRGSCIENRLRWAATKLGEG